MPSPTTASTRRRRLGRLARRILVAGAIAAVLVAAVAPALAQAWLRVWLTRRVVAATGCDVAIEAVELSFLQRVVRVRGMTIGAREMARQHGVVAPALTVELPAIDATLSWRALVRGRLVLDLVVDRPRLTVLAPDEGLAAAPLTATPSLWRDGLRFPHPLRIGSLVVHDGTVVWRRREPASTLRLSSIEAVARDLTNEVARSGTLRASARITGDGEIEISGAFDPLAPSAAADLGMVLRGLRIEAFDPLLRQALHLEVEHGRLDAYAAVKIADGALTGFIKPLVSDLDLADVSDRLRRDGLAGAVSAAAQAGVARLAKDRHGHITAPVPLAARLDQPGAGAAIGTAVREALVEATRRLPRLETRLGLSAWSDRAWRLALDALRVHDPFLRYGVGVAARRDADRTSLAVEILGGPGIDVGRLRLELMPHVGLGGARDRATGVVAVYGATVDATAAIGPAVIGVRAGWEGEYGFGGPRDVHGPMVGMTVGWRF